MALHLSVAKAKKLGLEPARRPRQRTRTRTKASAPRVDALTLLCRDNGLPEPVREYKFHPERLWRLDWAWPEYKIALEQEGGLFGRGEKCPTCGRRPVGAHSSITAFKNDMLKYREAVILGWRVLRCLPDEIKSGEVIELLKRVLK